MEQHTGNLVARRWPTPTAADKATTPAGVLARRQSGSSENRYPCALARNGLDQTIPRQTGDAAVLPSDLP
ncbi:MAG: hypothetical protein HZT40_11310 [Candidatus Thiothrix singaporensis]|uniref:Uncharacterized protein n=1 Tax=Candidatus Thiothrix singaporensis TaxID=2799669 RepID=A0A7L6AT24_9GAMM|nr:MAG: hypothetical protein HZT40_11310 [Candidatus Thiothrix singaporensis]